MASSAILTTAARRGVRLASADAGVTNAYLVVLWRHEPNILGLLPHDLVQRGVGGGRLIGGRNRRCEAYQLPGLTCLLTPFTASDGEDFQRQRGVVII